jgi:DNA-binding IclR family transcriptional regulator
MATNRSPRTLKTLAVASDVIDVLVADDGTTVTELAERLDISKSTAFRYLKSLEELGFVAHGDDAYRLSYRFLLLGEYTRNNSPLYRVGKQEVDKLADELGYYAHLVTETNGYGVSLYQAKGADVAGHDYQASKLQQRDPLHVTASGKAILAHLPRDRVDEIVEAQGFDPRTENTITDREELFETLESIRDRGVAYNDEEEIKGFRAVGVPVIDQHDRVLGSVSVSAPTSYLTNRKFTEEVPDVVHKAANTIEVKINMSERQNGARGP